MERHDPALKIELDAGAAPFPDCCANGKEQGLNVGPQQIGRREGAEGAAATVSPEHLHTFKKRCSAKVYAAKPYAPRL